MENTTKKIGWRNIFLEKKAALHKGPGISIQGSLKLVKPKYGESQRGCISRHRHGPEPPGQDTAQETVLWVPWNQWVPWRERCVHSKGAQHHQSGDSWDQRQVFASRTSRRELGIQNVRVHVPVSAMTNHKTKHNLKLPIRKQSKELNSLQKYKWLTNIFKKCSTSLYIRESKSKPPWDSVSPQPGFRWGCREMNLYFLIKGSQHRNGEGPQ